MTKRSRRQFLEESMLATAAAAVTASGADRLFHATPAPSSAAIEQLGVAVVGVRGRGNSHLGFYSGRRDTRVLYVCDVDRRVGMSRVEQVTKRQGGQRPVFEEDIRRVLEDPRVDIVSIATPNHWHALAAIWAMQAGKDVYVEKPVSHNVQEGRRMVEASRRYQRICQAGTQSRSNPGMISAIDYVRSGQIGNVRLARGLCYKRRSHKHRSLDRHTVCAQIPPDVNYDLWLGPAPVSPTERQRFHFDWHWQWPYGNGELGNQGVHQIDLCRWGLALPTISRSVISYGGQFGCDMSMQTGNTQVTVHDFGEQSIVLESRNLASRPLRGANVGVIFEGSDGYVVMTSYHSGAAFDAQGEMVDVFRGGGNHFHFQNFIQAVRQRRCSLLNADIEEGHLSSALCHTGNISYRLGEELPFDAARQRLEEVGSTDEMLATFDRTERHLEAHGVDTSSAAICMGALLNCDPQKESFCDHLTANSMLTRRYRRPFVVPTAGNV